MHHPASAQTLLADWNACKEAHTAATDQWKLERAWGGLMAGAAAPFLERLEELALAFRSTHGFDFDPAQAPTYGFQEETRDFDASVAARTSHMEEA